MKVRKRMNIDDVIRMAFIAGVQSGRKAERIEMHAAIASQIITGQLTGNGSDQTAHRNGLVQAANTIIDRDSLV
jgi:CHASE2 domain-containing sensor protein